MSEQTQQTQTQSPSQAPSQAAGAQNQTRRRYYARPRVCFFCVERIEKIDYKNVEILRRFLSEDAKIRGRKQTGVCAKHQRQLARAIKRARYLALLPYQTEVRLR